MFVHGRGLFTNGVSKIGIIHWRLSVLSIFLLPLGLRSFFSITGFFHPFGEFYLDCVPIDQIAQRLAGLRFCHGIGGVTVPVGPDNLRNFVSRVTVSYI